MFRLITILCSFTCTTCFAQYLGNARDLSLAGSDLFTKSSNRVFDNPSQLPSCLDASISAMQWHQVESLDAGRAAISLGELPLALGYQFLRVEGWSRHQALMASRLRISEEINAAIAVHHTWSQNNDNFTGFALASTFKLDPGLFAVAMEANQRFEGSRSLSMGFAKSYATSKLFFSGYVDEFSRLRLSTGGSWGQKTKLLAGLSLNPWQCASGLQFTLLGEVRAVLGINYHAWLGWTSACTIRWACGED